jgi:valyl-tRNA synthetase
LEAEKARLKKEIEKNDLEIAKIQERLSNPAFVEKVPPQVLAENQRRLQDYEGKNAQLKAALAGLED